MPRKAKRKGPKATYFQGTGAHTGLLVGPSFPFWYGEECANCGAMGAEHRGVDNCCPVRNERGRRILWSDGQDAAILRNAQTS